MKNLLRIALTGLTACVLHAGPISVTFSPSSQLVTAGNTYVFQAHIDGLGGGSPPAVGSIDMFIGFDQSLLLPVNVEFGPFLGDPSAFEALTDWTFSPGVLEVAEVSLLSSAELYARQPTGFDLASISFLALANGNASLSYLYGPIDDQDGTLIYGGKTPEPSSWLIACAGFAAIAIRILRRQSQLHQRAAVTTISNAVRPGRTGPATRVFTKFWQ